jgi:hypothetical protein
MEAENEKDKTMSDHETKPTADKPLSFACSECEFTTDDPVDGLMNHWDAAQHPDPEDELPYTYLSMTYKGVVIFGRIEHERETRAMREKFKTDFWANGVSKQVTDYDLLRFETNAENWSTPVCVPHSAASRDLLRDVLTSYLGKLYEEKANVEKYGMPGQSGDTRKEIKRVEKLLEMD